MGMKNIYEYEEPKLDTSYRDKPAYKEPPMAVSHSKPKPKFDATVPEPKGTEDWQLKKIVEHEGFRLDPYTDTQGYITGGVGHKFTKEDFDNFDPNWGREEKMQYWKDKFEEDYARANRQAIALATKYDIPLNDKTLYVLSDMAFNLGGKGLSGFKNFLTDLGKGDIEGAIQEMKYTRKGSGKPSKWYKQVPNRVESLAEILRSSNESSG